MAQYGWWIGEWGPSLMERRITFQNNNPKESKLCHSSRIRWPIFLWYLCTICLLCINCIWKEFWKYSLWTWSLSKIYSAAVTITFILWIRNYTSNCTCSSDQKGTDIENWVAEKYSKTVQFQTFFFAKSYLTHPHANIWFFSLSSVTVKVA